MTSRKAGWLAAAAFWTLFGLLTGLQVWISMITHGHSVPRLLGFYWLGWAPWLGFSAVIAWLARDWPIVPLSRRNILLHLGLALLIGILHGAYWLELTVALRPLDRMTAELSRLDIVGFLVSQLPVELILYGGVLAVLYGSDYLRRHREQQVRLAQLETSLTNARLHALELQIQPHFLFKTLNVISSLVRSGEQAEAVGMIAGLSDLLRYTLDHVDEASVTLDEEGAMLCRYLEIQRSRFPDWLTFGVDIEPEVRRAAVPTLILQPLAENAIRHGIDRSAGAGVVTCAPSAPKTGFGSRSSIPIPAPAAWSSISWPALGLSGSYSRGENHSSRSGQQVHQGEDSNQVAFDCDARVKSGLAPGRG
ncbi:MAG: sensor histidine kinase, partial [bacterium]